MDNSRICRDGSIFLPCYCNTRLLVEYRHFIPWGDAIHFSIARQIEIAYKLLYVLVFVGLVVPIGYFHSPFTIAYIGALLSFALPLMFSRREVLDLWNYSYLWLDE